MLNLFIIEVPTSTDSNPSVRRGTVKCSNLVLFFRVGRLFVVLQHDKNRYPLMGRWR